ncbi:GNAT family N-acetyltransferase [Aquimarina sp. ERC-38]|uniref:GNAT family N-acetyltransferase n=1 Tax=Aquimarina sp. ERC-38 TaxID=2949996 RepID=UPI002246487A|nr:GNAT family N-acetyltransferase [Aquimarina sp. ERC-38]UZO80790.1 GNAT family N-acetyltransferase [Aquimarina sp. ERC-38]
MQIRKALPQEAPLLSEIAFTSKAYWGYSIQQLEAWREELTINSEYIQENGVYVVEDQKIICGFYAYKIISDACIDLDFVFIIPSEIGKGYGSKLMQHFLALINNSPAKKIVVDSDPNAELFYKHFGFKTISKKPTLIKNRFLPVMELNL